MKRLSLLTDNFLLFCGRVQFTHCTNCKDSGKTFIEFPSFGGLTKRVPFDCEKCKNNQTPIIISKFPNKQAEILSNLTRSRPKAIFIKLQQPQNQNKTESDHQGYLESILTLTLTNNGNECVLKSFWVHSAFNNIYIDFIDQWNEESPKSFTKQSQLLMRKMNFIPLDFSHLCNYVQLKKYEQDLKDCLKLNENSLIKLKFRDNEQNGGHFFDDVECGFYYDSSDSTTDDTNDGNEDDNFCYSSIDSELYFSDFDPAD